MKMPILKKTWLEKNNLTLESDKRFPSLFKDAFSTGNTIVCDRIFEHVQTLLYVWYA